MAKKIDNFQRLSVKAPKDAGIELDEEARKGSLLTEEEMRDIEDGIKDEILAEAKAVEREKYKAEARRKIRIARGLEEPQVSILIDVPGFTDKIVLDGRPYYHGHTYTVPDSVGATLMHQMDMSWRHESNVGGANDNEYRKHRNTRVNSVTGHTSHVSTIQNSSINPAPLSDLSRGRIGPKINTSQNFAAGV